MFKITFSGDTPQSLSLRSHMECAAEVNRHFLNHVTSIVLYFLPAVIFWFILTSVLRRRAKYIIIIWIVRNHVNMRRLNDVRSLLDRFVNTRDTIYTFKTCMCVCLSLMKADKWMNTSRWMLEVNNYKNVRYISESGLWFGPQPAHVWVFCSTHTDQIIVGFRNADIHCRL